MARKSNAQKMFDFVQEYLNGDMERMFFGLDDDQHKELIQRQWLKFSEALRDGAW